MSELLKYENAFSKLKRGVTPFGLAPHKPIFLLTIIDLIDKGIISENKIYVNTELVAAFLNNWDNLVTEPFKPDFTQPFYYLQNDKISGNSFWFVKPLIGWQLSAHVKNFNKLITIVEYGYFSENLFYLLIDKNSRTSLKQTILRTYFPTNAKSLDENSYINNLSSDILNEPIPAYRKLLISTEEEVYVRNGLFKRLVPKVYYNSCAFTGWKVQTASGLSLVDACHIKPFSICKEDHINNGISLSPNIHRAFDRGLLSLDEDFKIIVSSQIIAVNTLNNSLKNLKGKKIKLPVNKLQYPGQEYLLWHRENCFKY